MVTAGNSISVTGSSEFSNLSRKIIFRILLKKHFPRDDHVLSPVEERVQRKVHREGKASDKDDEPEESVIEGEEGGEHVVDAMDGGVVRVLFDRVQKDPFLHCDILFLSIF